MDFKIALSPDVTVTEIDDRAVLFSKRTGDFFGLNPSALEMLKGLQNRPLRAVVEETARRYQMDEESIGNDLAELVGCLESKGLVTRTSAE